eukprot:scaffold27015_cov55-Phaeocystis_antarctica.AAC.2
MAAGAPCYGGRMRRAANSKLGSGAAERRTRERLAIFFSDIPFVILSGYFMMPATRAWPYGRSGVPSSKDFTMTAFLPACRPLRSSTTLPAFRNLGAFFASADMIPARGSSVISSKELWVRCRRPRARVERRRPPQDICI